MKFSDADTFVAVSRNLTFHILLYPESLSTSRLKSSSTRKRNHLKIVKTTLNYSQHKIRTSVVYKVISFISRRNSSNAFSGGYIGWQRYTLSRGSYLYLYVYLLKNRDCLLMLKVIPVKSSSFCLKNVSRISKMNKSNNDPRRNKNNFTIWMTKLKALFLENY